MITIIDYQMGNLRSVQKAFERVGAPATITSDPVEVARAEKLVLPGVGAFRDAIGELQRRNLVQPVRDYIASQRPFLGICLGLQLLFDVSYEDGEWEGLGVIPGKVVRFQIPAEYKVPHMGWNQVEIVRQSKMLAGVESGAHFYFVHSYYVVPEDPQVVALKTTYHQPFCAAIEKGNLFATQFHPEKSQANGLRMLENFARI